MGDLEAILRWLAVMTLLSAAALPLSLWLGRGLGRSSAALSPVLGIVTIAFTTWWFAAVLGLPFGLVALVLALLFVAAVSWTLAWHRGLIYAIPWRWFFAFQTLWYVSFLLYALFRRSNSDIAATEKPMEIALLSSVFRSTEVPAPDPWLAGEAINYYYLGFQYVASLCHLSGVPPVIGFNLALATIFATLVTLASAFGYAVAKHVGATQRLSVASALLASFFLVAAGNLESVKRLIQSPRETINAGWWEGVGWQASRIIVDENVHSEGNRVETINEFPAFSLVLGDLHPHLMAYPILLLVTSLAVGLFLCRESLTLPRLAIIGALAGLLYATNSWDAPVALGVLLIVIVLAGWEPIQLLLLRVGATLGSAILACLPFVLHYDPPLGVNTNDLPPWLADLPLIGSALNSIALVTWKPSSTAELLTTQGLWIGIAWGFVVWNVMRSDDLRTKALEKPQLPLITLLIIVAISIAWMPAMFWVTMPMGTLALLAFYRQETGIRLASALLAFGLLLILVPEVVYIQDSFGNRMNTVFKLHFQAWLFLSIGSAIAVMLVTKHARPALRWSMPGLAVVLIVLALPYTPLSASDWMRMGDSTSLDGSAYLFQANEAEAGAIDWINERADSDTTIVEAPGCGYGVFEGIPMNRMSAFTGVPTILGWANHERQWRRGQLALFDELGDRYTNANSWLDDGDAPVIAGAEPRFLIIGPQETEGSPNCDELQERGPNHVEVLIDAGWEVAYERGNTSILVRGSDPLADSALD